MLWRLLVTSTLLTACVSAFDPDDVQTIQSVKGGHGGGQFQYRAGENLVKLFGNNTQQGDTEHGSGAQGFQGGYGSQQGFQQGSYDQRGFQEGSATQQGFQQGYATRRGYQQGFSDQQSYGFQQGSVTQQGSAGQQGYQQGTAGQQGYQQGSAGQQGYQQGSTGQQGYQQGSAGQQDHQQGSAGQQGYQQGSASQQVHQQGSAGQQGYQQGSANQQGYQQGSGSQQGFQQGYGFQQGSSSQQNHQQGFSQQGYGGRGDIDQQNSQQGFGHQQGYGQHSYGSQQPYGQQGFGGRQPYAMRHNLTAPVNYEIGVCYKEVPTIDLVKDRSHVPAGNGSRPELSRIRTCCKGYIRNIHNYKICDPVCTNECVNALCTAPETCTCFPDHVKNLGGFCVATCPIGCQNGQCAGGECLCKDGYKLDSESKFCIPACRENCGGIGNCTSPDTCECRSGYKSTPEGSCKPACDQCANGDCVGPNDCRCHQGYKKDHQGKCVSQCAQDCGPNGVCVSNVCTYPHGGGPYGQPTTQPNQPATQPNQAYYQPSTQPPHLYPANQNQGTAQCSQPCVNGVCVEGNRCSCNPGYVSDRSDPTGNRCVPNCPGGCPNGVCSAPNFCICNMGYYKDHSVKGRPACVKRVRRSADTDLDSKKPINVAELLVFEIPDY